MLHWTPEAHALRKLPSDVKRMIKTIRRELGKIEVDGHPRLDSVQWRQLDDEGLEFSMTLEVLPGLLLTMDYDEQVRETPLAGARYIFADEMLRSLSLTLRQVDQLTRHQEEVRTEAYRCVAALQAEGLPTRLMRVTLRPHDDWEAPSDVVHGVDIEGLDDRLHPTTLTIWVEKASDLAAAFDTFATGLRRRAQARAELTAAGIDGTIDVLALAAIATAKSDTVEVLRRLGSNKRLLLPDGTCLEWENGNVRVAERLGDADEFSWMDGQFTSWGVPSDAGAVEAAVGRPVTDLLNHPYLTDEMIVRHAESGVNGGQSFTTVTLDMPRRRFRTNTGRAW